MLAHAMSQPRRSRPTAIHALMPSLPPGLTTQKKWIKFWGGKWRGSARVKATTYAQHGLWLNIVAFAMETGAALEMDDAALSAALGLGRKDRRARFGRDLERLIAVGLLVRLDNGRLFVPRLEELQGR